MSWDLDVYRFDGPPPTTGEEWRRMPALARPMGGSAEVREQISRYLPEVEWNTAHDPQWGVYTGAGYTMWIGVHIDAARQAGMPLADSFQINIFGGGDPLPAITRFCRPNGWSVLDKTAGDWLDLDAPSDAGRQSWQETRDRYRASLDADDLVA